MARLFAYMGRLRKNMAGNVDYGVNATETILTIEVLAKTAKLKKKETPVLAEQIVKTSDKSFKETTVFTETYWDYIQFKLSFSEKCWHWRNSAEAVYKRF